MNVLDQMRKHIPSSYGDIWDKRLYSCPNIAESGHIFKVLPYVLAKISLMIKNPIFHPPIPVEKFFLVSPLNHISFKNQFLLQQSTISDDINLKKICFINRILSTNPVSNLKNFNLNWAYWMINLITLSEALTVPTEEFIIIM